MTPPRTQALTAHPRAPDECDEEVRMLDRFREGEGDEASFHALLRPHVGSLLALARRLTGDAHWAEDLVQETLVRAYRGLAGFRGDASLRSWLFRIQLRVAAEPERWQRRERARPTADLDVPDHLDGPAASTLSRELRDRIEEALERLPPRQRTALHLRAFEGLDYAGIATAMGCSRGAARMLVLEARRRVLHRMGKYLQP